MVAPAIVNIRQKNSKRLDIADKKALQSNELKDDDALDGKLSTALNCDCPRQATIHGLRGTSTCGTETQRKHFSYIVSTHSYLRSGHSHAVLKLHESSGSKICEEQGEDPAVQTTIIISKFKKALHTKKNIHKRESEILFLALYYAYKSFLRSKISKLIA